MFSYVIFTRIFYFPTYLAARANQGSSETYPQNPKVVADMTSLHNIHEAGILDNLAERSKMLNQRPYTFMVSFAAV